MSADRISARIFLVTMLLFATTFACFASSEEALLVFAGAASKPPTELAAQAFTEKTGIRVDLVFGGSGYVLSQMELSKTGDIYFPGSSDYMDIAVDKGLVLPETEQSIVYLVNAINVQRGNPHNIKTLKDLAKPGLRVAIANPEGVCVGLYAVEILETFLTADELAAVKANIVNFPLSCETTATSISLGTADAVIGWRVFTHWDPERIETISLPKEQIIRIGYIPVAISKFSKNPTRAQKFIDFLISPEGNQFYSQFKYFSTVAEAVEYIGEERPVGGEYTVPEAWLPK